MTLEIALAITGIVVVGSTVATMLFDRMPAALRTTQKFSGFGLELGISGFTLILLVGTALASAGFVVRFLDAQREIATLSSGKTALETTVESLRSQIEVLKIRKPVDIEAYVTLELDPGEKFPDVTKLSCKYLVFGRSGEVVAPVEVGYGTDQVRVTLKDVKKTSIIKLLVIKDSDTDRIWTTRGDFGPFNPPLYLVKPAVK
ncbi:MAG: hypothetical protein ACREJO_18615 [Phycisphaerales bacterium]